MLPLHRFFLIAQCLLLCPALDAMTIRMAPASRPSAAAPLAAGAAASRSGDAGLGARSWDAGRIKLSAPLSSAEVRVHAVPMRAAPQAVPSAPAASAAQPAAAEAAMAAAAPQAAETTPAPAGPESSLGSLQAAAELPQKSPAQEAAAARLFDGAQRPAEPKEWTLMVFLNGHNNLDRFGEINIKQMEKVGSNDRVNIVVQWASLGKPTRRLLVQRSESGQVGSPILETLPAVDMGSADQLYEFIRWAHEHFPAQRYMVDLWDHGAGWHVSKNGAFSPLDISWDDQTGHNITTEQLGDVMRRVQALIGRPLDVLGFDACLMAMGEVVAQVADSVHYVAASEQTEPGAGWPYEKFLRQWLAAGADDGVALIKAITEQYVASYPNNVNFSGLDLAQLPALMAAAQALSAELVGLDGAKFAEASRTATAARRYYSTDYGDFMDFVTKLANAPGALVSAPVVAAMTAAHQALVVANAATPDLRGSNGMSIWLPMNSYLWNKYGARYVGLAWSRLTGWGNFVRRLAGAKGTDSRA
ncbi:MAG: clostripain-related cysteine peptidase [Elusimicrobiota bacterium]|jgi:hypothetical protein